jgi:acyl-CoA synthetase (AMP-forming)/AMP-acid ligase II
MRPRTFAEALRERALSHPSRGYTFSKEGEGPGERLSYAALDRRARAIGALLVERGAAGERVLLPLPPGPDFLAALFGCFYAGALVVPLPAPDAARPEPGLATLDRVSRDCGARFSFLAHAGLQALEWASLDPAHADGWSAPEISEAAPALIQYTSGSTSEPKGVIVRHANLVANALAIQHVFGVDESSRGVSWLPPYHDMGLMAGILEPLLLGADSVLMPPQAFLQRPLRWLQAISDTRATTCGGPDFAYELVARRVPDSAKSGLDLSCWSVAFCGAEPVRPAPRVAVCDAVAGCGFRREAFLPCYGLAESTLLVTGERAGPRPTVVQSQAAPGERARTLVGCGLPAPGVSVAVVDPDTHAPLPEGVGGEIWVKGPGVAAGYWGNPAASQEAFAARRSDGEGPYLRTGDLGFLARGELFPTGRLKDLIIVRGRNLYPQDVEATLERAHAALRPGRSAAFAATVLGQEQLVVACEVQRRAAQPPAEIADALKAAVAAEHGVLPHAVVLLAPGGLPRTSSGKPRRALCRALYEADELVGGPS